MLLLFLVMLISEEHHALFQDSTFLIFEDVVVDKVGSVMIYILICILNLL